MAPRLVQTKAALANPIAVNRTRSNEQRLLDLYAVRGGVTEVETSIDGIGFRPRPVDSIQSSPLPRRAHVVSVTPAPTYGDDDVEVGERTNVRRVVISKPYDSLAQVPISGKLQRLQQRLSKQQRRQQRFLARDRNVSL